MNATDVLLSQVRPSTSADPDQIHRKSASELVIDRAKVQVIVI